MQFPAIPTHFRLKEIDVSKINYKTTLGGIISSFAIGYNVTLRTATDSNYSFKKKVSLIIRTYKMLWKLLRGIAI